MGLPHDTLHMTTHSYRIPPTPYNPTLAEYGRTLAEYGRTLHVAADGILPAYCCSRQNMAEMTEDAS